MFKGDPKKVRTAEVRLSYIHLDTPYSQDGQQEPKYQATLLLPKTQVNCYNEIMQAINAAKQEGISNQWKGACPPTLSVPIHDGDGVRERSGEPYGDECKGHWVISAKSKLKPQVVHQSNINCELPPGSYKSGDYAVAMINFYPYDANGNRGVACSLGNIMLTRDGEALGGQSDAADDFSDFGGGGYSAPAPTTPQYAQPPQYAHPQQQNPYPPQQTQTAQPQGYPPQQGYAPPPNQAATPQQGYQQQGYPPQQQGYPAQQQDYAPPPPADNYFDPNAYAAGGYNPY